jgi:8-oxo-dGTP pyrophosphatase MutT (NUDIX family)
MLHHIQKSIMDKLATAESKRYGELKPAELDGNVFGYHLKALLVEKYVSKSDQGDYALTQTGKDYVVHRFENPLLQAHSIFLIALSRGDKWLLRERSVQPLLGMTGFIHGEPMAGEPLIATALRRLQEKTGLQAELRMHSSGLISITRDGVLESYSHAVVLVGSTNDDITITKDATGHNFWLSASELASMTMLPSCVDIISGINKHNSTPFDLHYNL